MLRLLVNGWDCNVFTGFYGKGVSGFYAYSPHFVSAHFSLTLVGECGRVLVLSVTCFQNGLLGSSGGYCSTGQTSRQAESQQAPYLM